MSGIEVAALLSLAAKLGTQSDLFVTSRFKRTAYSPGECIEDCSLHKTMTRYAATTVAI